MQAGWQAGGRILAWRRLTLCVVQIIPAQHFSRGWRNAARCSADCAFDCQGSSRKVWIPGYKRERAFYYYAPDNKQSSVCDENAMVRSLFYLICERCEPLVVRVCRLRDKLWIPLLLQFNRPFYISTPIKIFPAVAQPYIRCRFLEKLLSLAAACCCAAHKNKYLNAQQQFSQHLV